MSKVLPFFILSFALMITPAVAEKPDWAGKEKRVMQAEQTTAQMEERVEKERDYAEEQAEQRREQMKEQAEQQRKNPKGLEKQRAKKSEQVQKELDKGSEQGQESRENRRKWWKFWGD